MDSSLEALSIQDLIDNPTPRVAVGLCLDVSGSMSGSRIDELNRGVEMFDRAIKEDMYALYSAEIAITTFGGNQEVDVLRPFTSLTVNPDMPHLTANGLTPMGEAVNRTLDLLEARKAEYKRRGVDYHQPWLVIMTDGKSNGDAQELERAISRTAALSSGDNPKMVVFLIAIGDQADTETLKRFSPNSPVLRLKGLRFGELFKYLSSSISGKSKTNASDGFKFDIGEVTTWADALD